MKGKGLVVGLLLLVTMILSACTANTSLKTVEKQQIVEQVTSVEKNEYDLIYFNISYEQYAKALTTVVSEQYWDRLSEDTVFGYDNEVYTRDDLANMSQTEYDDHKKYMVRLIEAIGMDQINATVRLSDVYEGEQANQVHLYTIEQKDIEERPMTVTTKRYTLEKVEEQWLVSDVEQDKFTYGSDQTAEEAEAAIKQLAYQTHHDKEVGYPTSFVLAGVGKE